jgi:hypothetical protein
LAATLACVGALAACATPEGASRGHAHDGDAACDSDDMAAMMKDRHAAARPAAPGASSPDLPAAAIGHDHAQVASGSASAPHCAMADRPAGSADGAR